MASGMGAFPRPSEKSGDTKKCSNRKGKRRQKMQGKKLWKQREGGRLGKMGAWSRRERCGGEVLPTEQERAKRGRGGKGEKGCVH